MPETVDPTCFLGLPPEQRWQQLYWAVGGELTCFLGLDRHTQQEAFLEAVGANPCFGTEEEFLRAWGSALGVACMEGPLEALKGSIYQVLYEAADDPTLPSPDCFAGLLPEYQDLALFEVISAEEENPALIVYTSSVAQNDSDIETGGGADDTAAIQSLLDIGGTEERPLIVRHDGVARVTGLIIGPYTTLEGWIDGAGFYLADGSSRPVLQNTKRLTREGDWDAEIVIRNLDINGNAAHQNQEEAGLEAYGTFTVCVWMGHVSGFSAQGINFINTRTFAFLINDFIGGASFQSITSHQDAPEQYQDIVHVWGPGVGTLTVQDVSGNVGDDMVALNVDEIRIVGRPLQPYESFGDLLDPVVVDGVTGDEASQGVRLLSLNSRIENVTFRNITGTFGLYAVGIIYTFPGYNNGNVGTVIVENVQHTVKSGTIDWHGNPAFTLTDDSPLWTAFAVSSNVEHLSIEGFSVSNPDGRPSLFFSNILNPEMEFFGTEIPRLDSVLWSPTGTGQFLSARVRNTYDGAQISPTRGLAVNTGNVTVYGWMKSSTAAGLQTLVGSWNGPNASHNWIFYVGADGTLNLLTANPGSYPASGFGSVASPSGAIALDGSWQFVACRIDENSGNLEVRANGGAWVSSSFVGRETGSSSLEFGANSDTGVGVGSPMNGESDITVVTALLNDAEVSVIYAQGPPS